MKVINDDKIHDNNILCRLQQLILPFISFIRTAGVLWRLKNIDLVGRLTYQRAQPPTPMNP